MAELVPNAARPYLFPLCANGDVLPRIECVGGVWCFAFTGADEEDGQGSLTFTIPVAESAVSLNFSAVGSFGQSLRIILVSTAGGSPFLNQTFSAQPANPVAVAIPEGVTEIRVTVTGLGGSPTRIKNLSLLQ